MQMSLRGDVVDGDGSKMESKEEEVKTISLHDVMWSVTLLISEYPGRQNLQPCLPLLHFRFPAVFLLVQQSF